MTVLDDERYDGFSFSRGDNGPRRSS